MLDTQTKVTAKVEMVVSNRQTISKGDKGVVTDFDFQDNQPIYRIQWADGVSWAREDELEIMDTPTC